MTARERILGRITDLEAPKPTVVVERSFDATDLWAAFEERLAELGGRIIDHAEFVALQTRPTWADLALDIPSTAPDLWLAEVGFTVGDLAIAETGSIVVSAGPGKERLSSLVPPVNVIVVPQSKIVPLLADALTVLPDRNVAFITGPSRTADIEGVLVRGVHGPGDLLVYRTEG